MYGIDLSVQLENMMPFIGLGLSLGVIYDIFGIVRCVCGKIRAAVFAVDFVYCIIAAVGTYLLFLGTTSGVVRLYLLLSEITGAAVYFATAGRLAGRVCNGIGVAVNAVLGKVFSPFAALREKTALKTEKMRQKLFKNLQKSKNKLKKCLKDTA